MIRVLVTGAGGALGRALSAHLTGEQDVALFAINRSSAVQSDGHSVIACDLTSGSALESLLDEIKPDLIVNLAAAFDADFPVLVDVNVGIPQTMLHWALRQDYPLRIVLAGSAAEYGAVQETDNPVTESRALAPVSAYGTSKAWQTQLLAWYASQGVDVLAGRIFNLYGIGLSPRLFVGRVSRQIEEIKKGSRSTIDVGPLNAIRDYLDVGAAAALLWQVALMGHRGETYHVASGIPIRMDDMLQKLLSDNNLLGVPVRTSDSNSNRSGYDVPVIYADMQKTRSLLARAGET